jgi:hypothetical protein
MGARQKIENLIEKKRQEIADFQAQINKNEMYIQGLLDSLRFLPKEEGSSETKAEPQLRVGSDVYRAREFLKQAGQPKQIMDILRGIGKEATKTNRISLGGTISWWVRKGQIFTRPKPNTFGLTEFDNTSSDTGFGLDVGESET